MKKILCLIDTLGFGGGAERQIIGLVQLFKQRDYPVDIAIYIDNSALPELKKIYDIEPILLKTEGNPISKLNNVRNYIQKKGGYDCLIAFKDGPCQIGCLLKIMGMKFKLLVSERSYTKVLTKRDRIKFFLYRFADYIVPNSYSQGAYILDHYASLGKKIVTITNFTNTDLFTPINHKPADIKRVLTVARINKVKNILNYLDGIALLRKRGVENVHFDWVGSPQCTADELYAEEVHKKVKMLGLNDMLTFHPQTSEIVKYYQACDIFCLPSSFEGFPNVICEAMSCGKPIICSRVSDNPLIVCEGENGMLFDPEKPEDIAEKIQEMIFMPIEKRIEWGEKSRSMAVEMFSRDTFVDKYIKLIEK